MNKISEFWRVADPIEIRCLPYANPRHSLYGWQALIEGFRRKRVIRHVI